MVMKVMFFVSSLKYGGAQKTTVILANLFSEKGIETDLVVLNTEEDNGSLLSQVGKKVNIINLNQSKVVCSIHHLTKILKTNHYTHTFTSLSNPSVACYIAKLISDSKAKKLTKLFVFQKEQKRILSYILNMKMTMFVVYMTL